MHTIPLMRGRMRRSHYWLFSVALYVVGTVIQTASSASADVGLNVGIAIATVGIIILPALIIGVRRAHDIGSRKYAIAWTAFMLFYGFAVLAQSVKPAAAATSSNAELSAFMIAALIFVVLLTLAFVVLNFILLFGAGTVGPNTFGPDPRGRAAPANR